MIFLSVKSWFSRYFLIKLNVYKNLEKSFLEVFGAEKSRTQHFSSGKTRSVSPTVIVFVYLVKIGKLNLADLIVKNGLRLRDIVGKIAFGASRHYYQNIRRCYLSIIESFYAQKIYQVPLQVLDSNFEKKSCKFHIGEKNRQILLTLYIAKQCGSHFNLPNFFDQLSQNSYLAQI